MSGKEQNFERRVIEVPPELRGPSNEEILQRPVREDTDRRIHAAMRLSKRERLLRKMEAESAKMRKIAEKFSEEPVSATSGAIPVAKKVVASASLGVKSAAFRKLDSLFGRGPETAAAPAESVSRVAAVRKAVASAVPSSGRVLKGCFGAKGEDAPKAKVMSAAEAVRLRMEERAKKIRDALTAKNKSAVPVAEDGTPVKRPRGRPRKNPLPTV